MALRMACTVAEPPVFTIHEGGYGCFYNGTILQCVYRYFSGRCHGAHFISPIIVTVLSPYFLGEPVGIRRWAAVIIGFLGILLVTQPGFQEFRLGTLAGLDLGLIFALFQISTRTFAQQETPLVTVLYTALVGVVTMNVLIPVYWVPP